MTRSSLDRGDSQSVFVTDPPDSPPRSALASALRAFISLAFLVGCGGSWNHDVGSVERSLILPDGKLSWKSSEDSCHGPDCCLKGSDDGTCVSPELFTVPSADGKGMTQVRYVRERDVRMTLWGLASADGETIIPPALHAQVMALNSRALITPFGELIEADKTTQLGTSILSIVLAGGAPLHFSVLAKHEDGRCDLAPVLPSGKLGPTIPGALLPYDGRPGWPVGTFVVITGAASRTGPRASVFLDATGAIMPFGLRTPRTVANEPHDPDEALGWVVVVRRGKELEYRIGGGADFAPQELFEAKTWASAAALDAVQFVTTPEYPQGIIAGHRKDRQDWVAYLGRHTEDTARSEVRTLLPNDVVTRGIGATPEMAAFTLHRELFQADQGAEAERVLKAKQERLAAAQDALARREAEAERHEKIMAWSRDLLAREGHLCTETSWSRCRALEEASIALGEPYATAWYTKHGWYGGNIERACQEKRVSPAACALADARIRATREEIDEKDRARAAWELAFRNLSPSQPTVRVNYYEGGRLKQKEMSLDRYHQIYEN